MVLPAIGDVSFRMLGMAPETLKETLGDSRSLESCRLALLRDHQSFVASTTPYTMTSRNHAP